MKQILSELKLDESATEEQAVVAIQALRSELKGIKAVKYRGAQLSPEQEESVLRRHRAGLSMDEAIAAELAQAKHDEALAKAESKGGKGKGAAAAILLFLGLLTMPSRAWAQAATINVPVYTNVVSGFSTNTSANTPTNPSGFQINPGQNVSFLVTMLSTNAGTPNELFGYQGSFDFTNWTSSAALTGTVALGGSNVTVTGGFTFTNVPYNYLRWYSWGNAQTAAVSLAGAPMQAILK